MNLKYLVICRMQGEKQKAVEAVQKLQKEKADKEREMEVRVLVI